MNRDPYFRLRIRFSVLLLAVTLGQATAAKTPTDFLLEYSRGSCEGFCPEYGVRVDAAGHVTWQGHSSVARVGSAAKTLRQETVAEIVELLRSLQLAGATREIQCIDSPQYSISVRMNLASASIVVATCGQVSTPAEGRVLQTIRSLDRLIGVETWIGRPSSRR